MPGSLAAEEIDVIRLTAAGGGVVALLRAGSGADTSLMAAWPDGSGRAKPPAQRRFPSFRRRQRT